MLSHCLWISALVLASACAPSNKFKSGTSQGSPSSLSSEDAAPAPQPQPEPAKSDVDYGTGVGACIEGDKIVIPWSGPVKECFDQGKTYGFETKTCYEMRAATFSCDWETLQAKLQEKSLLTETLKADAAAGAKLISCGQSADGNRFAVQWVKLTNSPTQTCNTIKEGAGITTGCYTHYVDAAPPPPPKNDEERRQRVYACLGSL